MRAIVRSADGAQWVHTREQQATGNVAQVQQECDRDGSRVQQERSGRHNRRAVREQAGVAATPQRAWDPEGRGGEEKVLRFCSHRKQHWRCDLGETPALWRSNKNLVTDPLLTTSLVHDFRVSLTRQATWVFQRYAAPEQRWAVFLAFRRC